MSDGLKLLRFPEPVKLARPVLAASVAAFRPDGKVILAARTSPPASGVWSLPGGKVEAGETLEEAALRELAEEVGSSARIVGFNRHVEIIHRDADGRVAHHFVVASFVADWTGGEPMPGPEASAVMWADPAALGGLATTRELGAVLRAARAIWDASR
jgi:ADP-ribose pyrophosphatase YjhB (NUDIX family)